jgi:putative hydrolase of the HAD superfamily
VIRCVFFDAAGTLLEVAEPVGETYARFARRHGLRVDPIALQQSFLAAFAQSPPLAFPDAAPADLPELERAWWRRVVVTALERPGVGDEGAAVERTFDAVFEHFAMPHAWHVFGDVRPTLERLRTLGLRLAVVSNFDGRLHRLLEALDLAATFDAVVLSSECGFAKPDPRIFVSALEATGSRADETLHIGDSERLDLRAARAAGLAALRLDRGGGPAADTITGLAEVAEHLAS